jgi:phosphoribosylformylglycinamidine synthase
VCVGTRPDRIAILDNFCWPKCELPQNLGSLVRAAEACYDGALAYRTPFISGKDSLNNEYLGADGRRHAIPPTLLISAIGIIDDVSQAVTMDLKEAGNSIFMAGAFDPVFGGSHFSLVAKQSLDEGIPETDEINPRVYEAIHEAMLAGLIRSAHDLSEGGLAVAAAEMCIGGRLGMKLESNAKNDSARDLFGESSGTLLLEVRKGDESKLIKIFDDLPLVKIGTVTREKTLSAFIQGVNAMNVSLDELISAWNKTS